ncbi:MotA/TolQ/ExbB proton channel family protein [Erwinia sp. HDF1-3R]|uniref:MotA/TolQ/ExbB proton channel family protein n=1 Tax=Erwinia sp. HDF1-3R TaxID=3141543 RepID=UPI0031F5C907
MKKLTSLILLQFFIALIVFVAVFLFKKEMIDLIEHNKVINGVIVSILIIICVYLIMDAVMMIRRSILWQGFVNGRYSESIVFGRNYEGMASNNNNLLKSWEHKIKEKEKTLDFFSGTLICLGLLGTFIGLMHTMGSVFEVLGANVSGKELVSKLGIPLAGMSTAFSASMLGLVSSIIVGTAALIAGKISSEFASQVNEWAIKNSRESTSIRKMKKSILSADANEVLLQLEMIENEISENKRIMQSLINISVGIHEENIKQTDHLKFITINNTDQTQMEEMRNISLRVETKIDNIKSIMKRMFKKEIANRNSLSDKARFLKAELLGIKEIAQENTYALHDNNHTQQVIVNSTIACLRELNETKIAIIKNYKESD